MNAAQSNLSFSTSDRMGMSTFLALLAHMVIILGVTFIAPQLREMEGLPTLEVTLVQTRSETTPDEADFLAQFNQLGGGDIDEHSIARNPLPVREISEQNMDLPTQPQTPQHRALPNREITDLMSREIDPRKVRVHKPKPEKTQQQRRPRDAGFLQQAEPEQDRARKWAEINRHWQEHQNKPRHKFLNARTREYKYARYVAEWEAKVQRVGNLTYPDKVRRLGLSGEVTLEVIIKPNGTIHDITVIQSSGRKLLDDVAIRSAKLAAPFAPFPPEIRDETDLLHMTRTWQLNLPKSR
ncbi:MAG: energy transducer TonB [Acidiferrobacterales bacterium]